MSSGAASSSGADSPISPTVRKFPRISVACDVCNKRKSKCDGTHPCGNCARLGLPCSYSRVPRTTNAKKARSTRVKRAVANRRASSPVVKTEADDCASQDGISEYQNDLLRAHSHRDSTPTTPMDGIVPAAMALTALVNGAATASSCTTPTTPAAKSPLHRRNNILYPPQPEALPKLPTQLPPHLLPQAMQILQQPSLLFSSELFGDSTLSDIPFLLPIPEVLSNRPSSLNRNDFHNVRAPLVVNIKSPEVTAASLRGLGIDTLARRVHTFLDNYSAIHVYHWGWGNDVSDVSPQEDTLAAEHCKAASTPIEHELLNADMVADSPTEEAHGNTLKTLTGERIVPTEALDSLIDVYFEHIHPQLPCAFVHEPTFRATIPKQRPLLLNAMYAVAARFSKHTALQMPRGCENQAGEAFYQRAKSMLYMNVDSPSLDSVCALILLTIYAIGTGPDPSGSVSGAWMYSGMATRMAMFLDLNVDPDSDFCRHRYSHLPWLIKERRRRIWWACYIFDRYAAWGADRPTLVDEKMCNGVSLPAPESLWMAASLSDVSPPNLAPANDNILPGLVSSSSMSSAASSASSTKSDDMSSKNSNTATHRKSRTVLTFHAITSENDSLYARHVLLMRIVPKVLKFVQAFKSHKSASQMGSLADIEDEEYELLTLDAALSAWYDGLPKWMREPGFEFCRDLRSSHPPAWHLAFLLLLHCASIILLYQPRMMLDLQNPPRNGPVASPAFQTCEASAIRAFGYISAISASNPDWKYLSAWTPFLLYHIGLIHVIGARIHADEAKVTMARHRLKMHVKVLRRIGRFWAYGKRMSASLERMSAGIDASTAAVALSSLSSNSSGHIVDHDMTPSITSVTESASALAEANALGVSNDLNSPELP
ncbi:hypothetical protein SeMB42_g06951 [Synchytrium endobioticum]|uniref:Zn(2)-C6 fungal-type domain-containing protein n=1 Tax=Synchytrium endobioticum TaxID=286115 RepID=A0A507CHY9_9FUNG|nr:hypothetical protein SeMB42_g06951 [Synchytrium endobioticum]TPX40497.1 hypothetical protein SeLEV6574_g06595 [Synchytrium endobioticum]